jgi:hypothetical protein
MMGDFNARVGSEVVDRVVGRYGEYQVSENESRLICSRYYLKIANGFLQHGNIHRLTWTQETRQLQSILD